MNKDQKDQKDQPKKPTRQILAELDQLLKDGSSDKFDLRRYVREQREAAGTRLSALKRLFLVNEDSTAGERFLVVVHTVGLTGLLCGLVIGWISAYLILR